jgi:hypothetical protein
VAAPVIVIFAALAVVQVGSSSAASPPIPGSFVAAVASGGCKVASGFATSGASGCSATTPLPYFYLDGLGSSITYTFTVPSGTNDAVTYGIPAGGYLNNVGATVSVDGGAAQPTTTDVGGYGSTTSSDLSLWTTSGLGPGSHKVTIVSEGNSVNVYGLWIESSSTTVAAGTPVVSALSPDAIGFEGTPVTITGTGLSGATAVDFGPGDPATISTDTTTSLTVLSPPGAGTVDVTVTTPQGTSAVTAASAFTYLAIHVAGNRLIDGDGTTVQLVGVNRSGTEYRCVQSTSIFDGPSDASSVVAMAAWHINVVRIPLNEDCWLGINLQSLDPGGVASGAAYRQAIVDYVTTLNDAGIYAILDLSWNAPGSVVADLPSGNEQPMADEDHAGAFWTSVASTFRSDPAVLFDLYNEPHSLTWSCWLSGCDLGGWWNDAHQGGAELPGDYESAGMQELVNDVRAAGGAQPILLGGLGYASDLSSWVTYKPVDPGVGGTDAAPVGAPQLVASLHAYCGESGDPVCAQSVVGAQQATMQGVHDSVPVIIGEMGEFDCSDAYVDPYMAWADTQGISYLGWAWNTENCYTTPALIANFDGSPSCFGVGLLDHLSALEGLAPPANDIEGCASGTNLSAGLSATATSSAGGNVSLSAQGEGTVTVGQYPGVPDQLTSLQATSNYLDVSVSPGNSFSSLTLTDCNLGGGNALDWWNPSADGGQGSYQPVVGDPGPSTPSGSPSCMAVTLTNSTAPSLQQLQGAVFATLGAPSQGACTASPTVTESPSNATLASGGSASFSSTSSAPSPCSVAVAWQVLAAGGSGWSGLSDGLQGDGSAISGSSSDTLTITNVQTDASGNQYRAVFSDGAGTSDSLSASLDVTSSSPPPPPSCASPTITSNPSSLAIDAGATATFAAAASAPSGCAVTVQWQVSAQGSTTWSDLADGGAADGSTISGASTATLSIANAQTAEAGDYRAVFTDAEGPADSEAASLQVTTSSPPPASCSSRPAIESNPTTKVIAAGGTTTFSSSAGAPVSCTLSIQWQVLPAKGSAWIDVTNGVQADGATISGATTATLSISDVQLDRSGDEYRAVYTDAAGSTDSNPASLVVT